MAVTKRWYLSPLVGDGTRLNHPRALAYDRWKDSIVASINAGQLAPSSFDSTIPSLANGLPRFTWTICRIVLPDFAILDADINLALLSRESSLSAAPTVATDTALAKFGLVRDLTDPTLAAVIRTTMRLLEPLALVR